MKVSLLDNHKLIKLFSAIFELAPSLLRRWLICATTNLQLDHHWFNIEQIRGKLTKFLAYVGLIPAAQAPVKEKTYLGDTNLFYYLTQKKEKNLQYACHHISNQSVAGTHCRSLMFDKPIGGHALQQHVFKQIYLSMGLEPHSDCKNRCLMENTCVSVNVGPPSKKGLRVCQLSDSDHIQHPDDLKPREGYQYWATKVRIFG